MTLQPWPGALRADPLPWLLEVENPAVRYLVWRYVLECPADDPRLVADRQAILAWRPLRRILDAQWPAGYWMHPDAGYSPKYKATVWQIIFLAALGAPRCDPVERAIEYVLTNSRLPDGRFSAHADEQGAILCLNGNLLRAAIGFGYASDPRLMETRCALAAQVTGEGFRCRYNAPPGRRPQRMADGLPCAWGAVKALGALTALSAAARTPEEKAAMQQATDFLLAYDLASGDYPTATQPSPLWHRFGFPLGYTSDLLEALETLLLAGAPAGQPRLSAALSRVLDAQDAQGRWSLAYRPDNTWASFGSLNRPSKWVTWRALRVLKLAA